MAKQQNDIDDLEENDDAPSVDPQAAAKKKKLMLLVGIGVILLLLAGGGTWLALHLFSGGAAPAEPAAEGVKAAAAKAEAKPTKKPALYESLDPAFLANYSVGGTSHYLQVSLSVMTRDEATVSALHEHMPLIRNAIVMLLSGASFEQLQTDQGRVQLQQQLLAAIQAIIKKQAGKDDVEQVYFTNFVLQ